MKTWKLTSGILSIVLSAFVLLQSCAAGLYNTMESNGEQSGSAGFLVVIMLIAGGIVSIVTRNGRGKGTVAIAVLYGIGALVGFAMAGSFADLRIWAAWCLICAGVAAFSAVKNKSEKKRAGQTEPKEVQSEGE